ncbi:MAG: hypothetical protein U9R47_06230 [Actinomycetota bacterium]|nr:hypothetical protein [Actinomycetota bacterium]
MKRITLLTVVALVFSLFTVTAAIAGPGPDSREGAQVPDPITTQDRDQVQARSSDSDQDQEQAREQVQARSSDSDQDQEQAREQVQARSSDSDQDQEQAREQVQAQVSDPDQDQGQTQEQTQYQIREQVGDCSGDSSSTDCDPIRDETRTEAHNRVMDRFAVMMGDDGENAEYRHMFQWVWTFVLGPLRVLFF